VHELFGFLFVVGIERRIKCKGEAKRDLNLKHLEITQRRRETHQETIRKIQNPMKMVLNKKI